MTSVPRLLGPGTQLGSKIGKGLVVELPASSTGAVLTVSSREKTSITAIPRKENIAFNWVVLASVSFRVC